MASHTELSYDVVLPSAILVNENIELNAVKLYAFIKGLTKMTGYCFATNDYLSELMKSDPSSIKRWIGMLKKEGYVEVETSKNGVHWQRRLYISDKFKKCLRRLMDEPPPAYVCAPPSLPVSPITKDYSNEDNIKREEASPTPPSSFEIHKRVRMETARYDQLVLDFGLDKVKEMMERLDEYADINPKRFKQYCCHAAVIRKWIRDDSAKIKPWVAKKPEIDQNKSFAKSVIDKFPKHVNDNHIQTQDNGLLFCYGSVFDLIPYYESGFRDRVFLRLQKMNLPTNGL